MAEFIRAIAVSDLAPGQCTEANVGGTPVAIYNVDGEFYALDDTCTHEKFPLTEGWIDGDVVECALHMAKFCIRTGKALCLPANRNVASHAVEVVDGEVWIVTNPGGTP